MGKSCVQGSLQSVDLFGQSINFTIKGKEKTKSSCGGCVTLLLMVGLLVYALATLVSMLNKPFVWDIVTYENKIKGSSYDPN